MAKKKAQDTKFKLDVDTVFDMTGRGTVTWFQVFEEDDYGKIGGNFFPDDATKMQGVVGDLLAQAQAQCDEAGIEVTQVDPIKKTDEGAIYYKINRKAVKANGEPAVITWRNIKGNEMEAPEHELGNGSSVSIKYYASAYYMAESTPAPGVTVPARIGVSFSPLTVQVIDHKVYSGGGSDFDDESGDTEVEDDGIPFKDESVGSDDY